MDEIDYDSLAKKFGAIDQPAQSQKVDYDALAAQYGAVPENTQGQQQQKPQTLLDRFKANQLRQTESLKSELANESWLGRNAAGYGSSAAKGYYGLKQLATGELSQEDRANLHDWETISDEAPVGNIAGNIAMIALPGAALTKVGLATKIPALANIGRAITAPSTVRQAAAVGGGYAALQPTEQDGGQGFLERGVEGLKGAALGVAVQKGFEQGAKLLNPLLRRVLNPDLTPGEITHVEQTGVTPNELARMNTLGSLPVPITDRDVIRSQITRQYPEQEAERLVAGQPIIGSNLAGRLDRGQVKMAENLDALADMTKAKAPTREQAGETMRSWMQNIYGAAKEDTKNAYNYAKELHGDTTTKVNQDIVKALSENQAMPGYKELLAQAKNMGIVKEGENGLVAGTVKINDLDKYKSIANTLTQSSDGMTRHAGGDIVNKVYSQLDNVAPEFKQAAALRKRQGAIFEGPSVTQKILGTKEGAYGAAEKEFGGLTIPDYKVSSEKLIDTVMNGGISDVKYIRDLALNGTKAQRTDGVQSIREMRGAIIENMKDVWTKTQTPQAKANQLNKYLDKLGEEKIQILFGNAGARQVQKFRDAAEIMNKGVPSPEGGSQTAGRLLNMASQTFNILSKIPIAGSTTAAAAKGIADIHTAYAARNIPVEKLVSPARKEAANKLMQLAPYGTLLGAGYSAE